MGLPANLLSLYAFSVKIHSRLLPTDILLLNLTVPDLLFFIILPLRMHKAASGMKWHLSIFLCSITTFTFFSTIYTSSLLLMAVSVVCYIGVAFPVTYHQLLKPVYVIVVSAVIWLISAAHCIITFIIQHHPSLASKNSQLGDPPPCTFGVFLPHTSSDLCFLLLALHYDPAYTLLLCTFNTCIDPMIFYFSSSFHCTSKNSLPRTQV
uniref:Si:ch211-231m23.4 n=1 Tax=Cyclopterus lumpus TaxID=8103 RepID=A0A8C2ZXS5_CYCLU